MHSFTDKRDRTWQLDVNVDAVEQIRTECQIDLLEATDPEAHLLDRLAENPVKLVAMLYVLCREQAEADGVTPRDFGRAMGGEAIDRAAEAFEKALVDFFPRLRRLLLGKALEKTRATKAAAVDRAVAYMESPAFAQKLDRLLSELDRRFSELPESSASTPDPGPSAAWPSAPTSASRPSSSAAPG
jgi:hypothetical protein